MTNDEAEVKAFSNKTFGDIMPALIEGKRFLPGPLRGAVEQVLDKPFGQGTSADIQTMADAHGWMATLSDKRAKVFEGFRRLLLRSDGTTLREILPTLPASVRVTLDPFLNRDIEREPLTDEECDRLLEVLECQR